MPSLIYIARIRSVSEELARSLRSAGCQVELFKPGDITQDECLLAMTPEAAVHPQRVMSETGRNHAGTPAPGISRQRRPDAAVWDCLKAAVAKELRVSRESVRPATSSVGTEAKESGFVVAEAGRRDVLSGQGKVNQPQGKVNQPMAPTEPPPITAASSWEAPHDQKNGQLALEKCRRVFRSPLSTVAAVLAFAVVYRGLPSMTASPGRAADRASSALAVSAEPSRREVERMQKQVSLDGFVAEDYTNHPALHAPSDVTQRNIDLRHLPRVSTPKRVVVD
jgi:hypothetical protein